MRFAIITGMSGAGKSSVLNLLEDGGFFCVDNLPVQMLPEFADMSIHDKEMSVRGVAVGVDIRSSRNLDMLGSILDTLQEQGIRYEILFLECRSDVLVRRFKETRRRHPLNKSGRIEDAIAEERTRLRFLKKRSDYIIDTSTLLIRDLTQEIRKIFFDEETEYANFYITLLSFGYKYGIPDDADLVFDVRFLPNPYYVPELKHLTGNDQAVRDYVMQSENADIFLSRLYDLLSFLIPLYMQEGKNGLIVAIGCTGGRHRSVTITNELYDRMRGMKYSVRAEHRDAGRDSYISRE